jgi:hypothetical protein
MNSMLVFPQSPQLVEIVPNRWAVAGVNFTAGPSVMLSTLPSEAGRVQ